MTAGGHRMNGIRLEPVLQIIPVHLPAAVVDGDSRRGEAAPSRLVEFRPKERVVIRSFQPFPVPVSAVERLVRCCCVHAGIERLSFELVVGHAAVFAEFAGLEVLRVRVPSR